MKTDLQILIHGAGLDPVKTMNALQGAGVISDNAVEASDVANSDAQKSWDFLTDLGEKQRAKYPA